MSSSSDLYNKVVLPAVAQPGDTRSKMYKGFSTVSPNTENYNLYDFDLIKQDILNHFYTRQGERLMNPTFGCIIWDLLFEPLTPAVQDLILQNVNVIVNYDPRVQSQNVVVTSYDTGIQIELTLLYVPYNLQQTLQLQFDQANNLVVR